MSRDTVEVSGLVAGLIVALALLLAWPARCAWGAAPDRFDLLQARLRDVHENTAANARRERLRAIAPALQLRNARCSRRADSYRR